MSNTKKIKGPGRPKSDYKDFLKKKEDKHIIRGRGRPKKHVEIVEEDNLVDKEMKGIVDEKVAREKKKDTIILLLFIFSVLLFVFSILTSVLQKKKNELMGIRPVIKQEKNIQANTGIAEKLGTGTATTTGTVNPNLNQAVNTGVVKTDETVTTGRKVTEAGQAILNFYNAFNTKDTQTMVSIADTHLRTSTVFRTYFNLNWISKFLGGISQNKIFVLGIVEKEDALKPNIKNIDYSITYRINGFDEKFVEQRAATLIKRGEEWKIGKIMCVTPGCSLMPFFNPGKYGIK